MTDAVMTPVPAKGLFARAIGVVTAPKATFEAVVANPKPAGILFIAALVIGLAQGLPQFTESGRQAALAMNIKNAESFTGQPLNEQAIERMKSQAAYGPYMAVGGSLIVLPLFCLLFALIYWAVFNVTMGGTATFKQVLAIVAHSQVIGALGLVITAPIQYFQGVVSAGGPFNLGMLVPMLAETSAIAKVLAATSVFTIWGLLTTGTGLGVLFKRSGLTIGLVLTVFYFAIAIGIASLFTR